MASAPAWQTEELGEEWVETSPSPPGSPEAPPPAASRSKRGSLRSLGAGVARPLPPSRKGSAASMPEFGRSPSNPYMRSASGMLSPPTSASGSEGGDRERQFSDNITNTVCDAAPLPQEAKSETFGAEPTAGTFLVKDGEDTHGKAFPRNPFQKDMFSALALEKMFEPPSPPVSGNRVDPPGSSQPVLESVAEGDERWSSPVLDDEHGEQSTPTSSRSSGTFKALSPVSDDVSPSPAQSFKSGSSGSSSTVSIKEGNNERRASHPYAPVNPSRLSKSVTPSDSSFATTEATHDKTTVTDMPGDEGPTFEYHTHDVEAPTVEYHTIEPTEIHQDSVHHAPEAEASRGTAYEIVSADQSPVREAGPSRSPSSDSRSPSSSEPPSHTSSRSVSPAKGTLPLANPKYPFTFTAPVPHAPSAEPIFDPSLEPLPTGEPSSSTLRNRPVSRPASGNIGLRLFRNTYDTYTRQQLSAIVDSIPFQESPSPPAPGPSKLRAWSADSETPVRSNSSGNPATPTSGSSNDGRSSKRLRLSPPSPRSAAAVRDWRAHGRALMDRIRVTDPEVSATSESRSGTGSWGSITGETRSRSSGTPLSDGVSGDGAPTFDYTSMSRLPDGEPSQYDDGRFKSNPSTASSTYLHRAEDMMSRIKGRGVSPSTSTTAESPLVPRRALSDSSHDAYASSEAEQRIPRADMSMHTAASGRTHAPFTSPSESDESRDMSLEDDDGDEPLEQGQQDMPMPAIQRSGSSRASIEGAGLPPNMPVNRDDLNRYISASTYMTGTTVSTSFVKHPGPRDPAQAPQMTQIRPGDVQDVLSERVGKMRYDRASMRWVRDGNGSLGRVDEAGESRTHASEESVDIFAGIESIGSGERTRGSSLAPQRPPMEDESDTETEESPSPDIDRTPRPQKQHTRPIVQHSASAPALKTPGPATPGPQALRSALRNPNTTPASAMKKQAAWHPDLTPAPQRGASVERIVSVKRSVSFSDGYIAPPRSAGGSLRGSLRGSISKRRMSTEVDLFEVTTNGSWMPSARTRRIQDALDGMAEMTIEDNTPTKPRDRSTRSAQAPDSIPVHETEKEESEEEDTVEPVPFGGMSFRSARRGREANANATFLTECSFGIAHDKLVQLITDVQPFEPYWEQLRTIDLSNKGVESLARLKEFLPMLDEARLDNNAIDYLSGVPNTIRTLHVAGNHLTSLTSVNHLRNLQYLDISRNQLDSVGQLECLYHLRELKADNNMITDLSGILSMDSLLKLSVSGNKLERVDLTEAKWDKLENLNLSRNKITSITGLHKLQSVSTLNLDRNCLTEIDVSAPLQDLRVLRFSDNNVTHIDLSLFPKVRTLFADNNALAGLSRSLSVGGHRIENLSIRNQRVERLSLSAEDLQTVKRLYVSGNRLDADFLPRHSPLFNLVYLEAAACNLASWPTNFAQRAPNLRILNVNYNFLPDLDGLAGLVWLRKLMVVGNRLGGGGPGAARGLRGLTALEEIDLRMNPSTLSFYLPIMLPSSPTEKSKDSRGTAPDSANWPALDAQFRRQLPDEWYSKRLVYRGLVMAQCPELRMLDAVAVHEGEKRKAALLLEYAGQA